MKKALTRIIHGAIIATASAMLISAGAKILSADQGANNPSESRLENKLEAPTANNPTNAATNNVFDVSGRWYAEAAGGIREGWCWGWENLWIEQKGTNLSGTHGHEFYNPSSLSGSIQSNKIKIGYQDRFGEKPEYGGSISNNEMVIRRYYILNNEKMYYDRVFVKITNDLPYMDPFYKWHTKKEENPEKEKIKK